MGAAEIAELVGEWCRDRWLDMADEGGVLDGRLIMGSTHIGSHAPSVLRGGSFPLPSGRRARRFSPPDAGPAA